MHSAKILGGRPQPCRPRRDKLFCPHGRPLSCMAEHVRGDDCVGAPLCQDCYDYEGAVLFNFRAGELWNRFCRAFRRQLAAQLGVKTKQLGGLVRVSFVKVGEMQRRAVIHFHAIIRLDRPGDGWLPPDIDISYDHIDAAARAAAAQVTVTVTGSKGPVTLRWGQELDVQPIRHQQDLADDQLTPKKLSAYLSKYTCKSAGEPFGLDGRVRDPDAARALGAPPHLVRMMETALRLSTLPGLERLHRWVQTLGFPGHFTSKSRQWSVTLGELRAERLRHCRQEQPDDSQDEETTLLIGERRFAGVGWKSDGEAALVDSARRSAIDARQYAIEARWAESGSPRSPTPRARGETIAPGMGS